MYPNSALFFCPHDALDSHPYFRSAKQTGHLESSVYRDEAFEGTLQILVGRVLPGALSFLAILISESNLGALLHMN